MLASAKEAKDELLQMDQMRIEKLMSESDFTKNQINQFEQKLYLEMEKRLSNDYQAKQFLEQNLGLFKEELVSDRWPAFGGS